MRARRTGTAGLVRAALAACVVALLCAPARAIDFITITIPVEDSEIITTDLKRIRLAEPAEVRFALTTNYIELLYGTDLTTPRRGMRLEVVAAARGTLGALTGAEATRDEGTRSLIAAVNRRLASMGVTVESHTLRYVFLPGYGP